MIKSAPNPDGLVTIDDWRKYADHLFAELNKVIKERDEVLSGKQTDLFTTPALEQPNNPNNAERADLRLKTRKWINDNPKISALFLELARKIRDETGKKFGMKYLAEKVRWEYSFRYNETFKINNNYGAYIARWLISQDLSLEQYMSFRTVGW